MVAGADLRLGLIRQRDILIAIRTTGYALYNAAHQPAHSPQPTGLYGSDRHSIGLLPKRFISKQSPCGCVLRIVELTLIRSELSSLDMPKPGMTYTFRG